jgi:hypothetical protein
VGRPDLLALFDPFPPKSFQFFLQDADEAKKDREEEAWYDLAPDCHLETLEEKEEIEKIKVSLPTSICEGLENRDLKLAEWCDLW